MGLPLQISCKLEGSRVRNAHAQNANGDLTRTIIVVTRKHGVCYSFACRACAVRIHAYAKSARVTVKIMRLIKRKTRVRARIA